MIQTDKQPTLYWDVNQVDLLEVLDSFLYIFNFVESFMLHWQVNFKLVVSNLCVRVWFVLLLVQPTKPAAGKQAPRKGNIGHITRICNKLGQLGNTDSRIRVHLEVCYIS